MGEGTPVAGPQYPDSTSPCTLVGPQWLPEQGPLPPPKGNKQHSKRVRQWRWATFEKTEVFRAPFPLCHFPGPPQGKGGNRGFPYPPVSTRAQLPRVIWYTCIMPLVSGGQENIVPSPTALQARTTRAESPWFVPFWHATGGYSALWQVVPGGGPRSRFSKFFDGQIKTPKWCD